MKATDRRSAGFPGSASEEERVCRQAGMIAFVRTSPENSADDQRIVNP
ncbi:hypothetical protein [Thermopirellula anaerolimosa]